MPPMVDKSHLVARFTAADGTTLRVNGVEQVSQATANDFRQPVDYILTRDGVSRRMAVNVYKKLDMKWREIAPFDEMTTYGDPVLKISPATDEPYVGFKIRRGQNDADANRCAVMHLTADDCWEHVSGGAFGSMVNSSYFDFDISPEGTLYVAYSDQDAQTANPASLKNAMSAMAYDGTEWQYVGGQGALKAVSGYLGMAALAGGELVAAQVNSSSKAAFANRSLVVSNFTGGAWSHQVPSMITNNSYMSNVAGDGHAAYVISINRGMVGNVNYGYNVLRYADGQWSPMVLNFLEPGNTFNNIYTLGITVARGVPYIWTLDNAAGQTGLRVKYYDGQKGEWVTLGGNPLPLGFVAARQTTMSLDVTSDGTVYVVYNNMNDFDCPYFMYLDPDTGQWSKPEKIADKKMTTPSLRFTHKGVGYLTLVDGSSVLHTFKYE